MAGIKGLVLEIAGNTSPLVNSLKQADTALKNTNTALKAVDKALKLDPTNVELLAQKEALLGNAVSETKDRLETLKQAAEEAAKGLEEGTVTQEQYAQLTAEIATTEQELKKLEQGGEEVAESGEKASRSWEGFGDVVAKAGAVAAAGIAALTTAAVAAGKALIDCTTGGAEFADEMLTLSSTTGVSTETLQEWSYAAELIDVSVDTMAGSLAKTTRAIAAVADGSQGTIDTFDRLGVSALDSSGNMRDSEDVFMDIVDALGTIENETERDAIAMELLGKSAQDLNPLIEAGSDTLRELGEEAHEAGYVLDGDTLSAFGAFDDQMQKLQLGTTAAKNALGTVLLPVLSSLAGDGVDFLGEFTNAVLEADGDVEQIGAVIGEMIPQAIGIIMEYLPMLIELAGTLIEAVVNGLLDNLGSILETAVELVLAVCDGILSALPELIPVVVDLVMTIVTYIVNNLPLIINAAIQIIIAVVNGITQALPQLIPAIVQAIITITTTLIQNLPLLLECGMELILALVEGILNSLPDIIAGAMDVVNTLVSTLGDAAPQIVNNALSWGADLISSFVSGIRNAIPNLVSGLTEVASTVASYLHFTSPDVGPLAHDLIGKSGKDMIDTFAHGITSELGTLESALTVTGNTIAGGMSQGADYSGVLQGIQNGVADLGSRPMQVIVMVGNEQLDSYIVNATTANNYVSGGY